MGTLMRLWVFCTGLMGLLAYVMLGGIHNADLTIGNWLGLTAMGSGLLFLVGGGLVWVARGSQRGA
jgi:hypothetical protein